MNQDQILLVEDNPDDVELTMDAFRRSGIANTVVVARDGAEALDYLAGVGNDALDAPRSMPAVVILDINLPKFNGLEVLRRVRADARTRFLPVVLLTTSVDDRDVVQGYSLGANAYVRKPVAYEDFIQATSRLGLFWLHANVRAPALRAT